METDDRLISRVRSGDRQALALFVQHHEAMIRARFRDQFASRQARLFDSSDFFATVFRRIDGLFASFGRGKVQNTDSLTQTLERIMLEAMADFSRAAAADHAQGLSFASPVADDRPDADPRAAPLTNALRLAGAAAGLEPTDCQILRLRADGSGHQAIACALGMSVAAVRMRWHRISSKLRESARAPVA